MSQSQPRRRNVVILTLPGFQKLQTAQAKTAIWNDYTKSCTLEALSEQTGLSTHTLSKVHARKAAVDFRTLTRYFNAFNLPLEASDYMSPLENDETTKPVSESPSKGAPVIASRPSNHAVSWGMAPDVSMFCGRATELSTLQQWILQHRCRLITLSGMGGIGKTWLATKLAEQIQPEFKSVVWRSLRPVTRAHSPITCSDFLDDLIRCLIPQSNPTIPETVGGKIRQLVYILRCTPCLLVLDQVESILPERHSPTDAGTNSTQKSCPDYEAYGELLRQFAQGRHQSCVVLTSGAKLKPIQLISGDRLGVRSLPLQGMSVVEIQQMYKAWGIFQGTAAEWSRLVGYYGGNPLMLGIVAATIQDFCNESITDFFNQNNLILEDIGELLDQQLSALSAPEQDVIKVLATQDGPISLSALRSQFVSSIPTNILLFALTSLKTRSLINANGAHFSLQPLLGDYVRTRADVIATLSSL